MVCGCDIQNANKIKSTNFGTSMKASATQRPISSPKLLRSLWPFLKPNRGLLVGAFAALLVAAAATLAVPVAFRGVIDQGFNQEHSASVDDYFLALMVVAFVLAFSTAVRFYFVTKLGETVVANLRKAVFSHVLALSPEFFEQMKSGEVLSRLTADTTVIQGVVGSSASIALRNIVLLLGGISMLLLTSAKLTMLVFVLVPIVVVPIIFFGRRVRSLSRLSQDKIADASAFATETLSAVSLTQSFVHEDVDRQKFSHRINLSLSAAFQRIMARSMLTFVVISLIFTGIAGVLWIGAYDVLEGRMSAGELTQFVLYAVFVAGSVGALSEIWGELQRAAGATERLQEILTTNPIISDPENPQFLEGRTREISFKDVKFSYPSQPGEQALNGLNVSIPDGQTVAIVGPSGAGKTTFFQLLQRFYDVNEGGIFLNNLDVRSLGLAHLRSQFALVPQDSVIFSGSLYDNILFGRPDATEQEVMAAAKAAHVDEFVGRLTHGYDTELGERGVKLSGGQRQRVAIARALLRDAPILLLDEATSSLDAASEVAVQQALEHLMHGRTTLVIAHRLATVRDADHILVLDQGQLVEQGSHEQLVAADGIYARLAELQFRQD